MAGACGPVGGIATERPRTRQSQNLQSFPCAGVFGLRDCHGLPMAFSGFYEKQKSKNEGSRALRMGPLRRQWKPSLHVAARLLLNGGGTLPC